jgi:hypothetical protein
MKSIVDVSSCSFFDSNTSAKYTPTTWALNTQELKNVEITHTGYELIHGCIALLYVERFDVYLKITLMDLNFESWVSEVEVVVFP